MAAKGLKHIALKCRNLKKTEEFYTGVLGMKVAFRHPPAMLFLTTPGSGDLINFVKSTARPKGTQSLEHLGFKVTPRVSREPPRRSARGASGLMAGAARRRSISAIPTAINWNTTATRITGEILGQRSCFLMD